MIKKFFVLALVVLFELSTTFMFAYKAHVRSYNRKDGTHVSSYTRNSGNHKKSTDTAKEHKKSHKKKS